MRERPGRPAAVGASPSGGNGIFRDRVGSGSTPWLVLTIICGIALVTEMGSFVAAPMAGVLAKSLHLTPTQAQWATIAPLLISAASNGLLGKVGDMYGHRRILLCVLSIQFCGNFIAATAGSFIPLAIGRGMVGIAGSQGLTLAILRDRTPVGTQRRGVGMISGIQGIGIAPSFMIGGLFLAAHYNWNVVFFFSMGLNLIALLGTFFFVPESVTRAKVKLDWKGALGLAIFLGLLDVAFSESSTWGRTDSRTLICFGLGILGAVIWWNYQHMTKADPLIHPSLLKDKRLLPTFCSYACMTFAAFTCYIGITNFAEVPRAIAGYGFTATVLGAGAILIPASLAMGFSGSFVGPIVNKSGARTIMIVGQLGLTAVFLFWWQFHSSVWFFLVGGLVFAPSLMFVFTSSFSVVLTQAPRDSVATVSSMLSIISSFGSNIGTAVFVAFITAEFVPGTPISVESGFTHLFLTTACVLFVGFLLALLIPRGVAKGGFDEPDVEEMATPSVPASIPVTVTAATAN
jgi:MFS family permease